MPIPISRLGKYIQTADICFTIRLPWFSPPILSRPHSGLSLYNSKIEDGVNRRGTMPWLERSVNKCTLFWFPERAWARDRNKWTFGTLVIPNAVLLVLKYRRHTEQKILVGRVRLLFIRAFHLMWFTRFNSHLGYVLLLFPLVDLFNATHSNWSDSQFSQLLALRFRW